MSSKIILGFDVSSSCIGWSVLEVTSANNIFYKNSGYLKLDKKDDLIKFLAETRDLVKNIIDQAKPDEIVIEDLIKYMKFSTASTVSKLAVFNRMVALLSYDYLLRSPKLLAVATIRASLRKGANMTKAPPKEDIPATLELILSNFKFPWEFKKQIKNKPIKPKEENFDRADGIAVALAHALKLTKKIK